jgi:hypothetical protein
MSSCVVRVSSPRPERLTANITFRYNWLGSSFQFLLACAEVKRRVEVRRLTLDCRALKSTGWKWKGGLDPLPLPPSGQSQNADTRQG